MYKKRKMKKIFTGMAIVCMTTSTKFNARPITSGKYEPNEIDTDALRVQLDNYAYNVEPTINIQQLPGYARTTQNEPYVVETTATKNGVRYVMSNGDNVERRGGTIAWRNNNPGCIRYSQHAVQLGATGTASGFAIFPDEKTGIRAIESLLRSDGYINLTIGAAITKYAPPHENDTSNYIARVSKMTGLSAKLRIRDLNDEQMLRVVDAIRTIEGWRVGTETKTLAQTAPDSTFNKHTQNVKLKYGLRMMEYTL